MEFGGRERGGGRVFEGKVGLEERPRIVDGPGGGIVCSASTFT